MPDLASDFRPYLRKERDWLIRAASGPDFFPALSQALRPYPGYPDLEGPLSWHIDVHIDWIIAVLGGGSRGSRLANPSIDGKKLIRGSNEDFDLICFAGQDLVIVEA